MLLEDVIIEVLLRLPVKTIIHCKSVSKRWRDIISDPYFVNLHISRSRECLLIHELCPGSEVIKWVEIKEADNQLVTVKTIDFSPYGSLDSSEVRLLGSVNGLLTCWDKYDDSLYIVNPVYDEYLSLYLPLEDLNSVTLGYGFGVSSAEEYKVIWISRGEASVELNYSNSFKTDVYTLGTCQWRSLGQTTCRLNAAENPSAGLYLDSHVYWELGADNHIYDLDLVTETFELFPMPPVNYKEFGPMLGVLKGRIICIAWSIESGLVEIWVMKERSWYKEIIVQDYIKSYFYEEWWWGPRCVINGLNGNSILLFECGKTHHLLAYFLDTRTIVPQNLHCSYGYGDIISHRPSFLFTPELWIRKISCDVGRK